MIKWKIENCGPYGSLANLYCVGRINPRKRYEEGAIFPIYMDDEYFNKDGETVDCAIPEGFAHYDRPAGSVHDRDEVLNSTKTAYYESVTQAEEILKKYGQEYEIITEQLP